MGFGVNVQIHGIPWLSPSGAGFKRRSIGHHNRNFMVFWVNARFHNKKASFKIKGLTLKEAPELSRTYLWPIAEKRILGRPFACPGFAFVMGMDCVKKISKKTLHTGRSLCITGFVLIAPTEVCKGNARKAVCQRFWGLYAK